MPGVTRSETIIMAIRLFFFLLIHAAIACTQEEKIIKTVHDPIASTRETSTVLTNFHDCDSIAIATSPGTACCVSGPIVAKPGDTLKYHYQINQDDPQIYWEVLEGDAVIIDGADMHTVAIKFGPNFTSALIQGRARGDTVNNRPAIRCEEAVSIKLH